MTFQEAFNYLVDDLEGASGKPSIYGDTFGINPGNWNLYAKKKGIRQSVPTRVDDFGYYNAEWWLPFKCDQLPNGIDFCLFEWIVNHGPVGIKDLQVCVGVAPDGIMGPETIRAAHEANAMKVINCFLNRQKAWYIDDSKRNPDAPLVGWEDRIDKIRKIVGLSAEEKK